MSALIRLIYVSTARFKAAKSHEGIEPTVARILMSSRSKNPQHQIGGVLYYGDGYFFQLRVRWACGVTSRKQQGEESEKGEKGEKENDGGLGVGQY